MVVDLKWWMPAESYLIELNLRWQILCCLLKFNLSLGDRDYRGEKPLRAEQKIKKRTPHIASSPARNRTRATFKVWCKASALNITNTNSAPLWCGFCDITLKASQRQIRSSSRNNTSEDTASKSICLVQLLPRTAKQNFRKFLLRSPIANELETVVMIDLVSDIIRRFKTKMKTWSSWKKLDAYRHKTISKLFLQTSKLMYYNHWRHRKTKRLAI